MIEEIDCVERYPPVNTGWAYRHLKNMTYVYRQGMIYYASILCSLPLSTPHFYKAMHLHALSPSLIPKDHPTTATSATTTTTRTTTTSPMGDNSTTPVLPSTTEAPTTATEAVNDDVRHEYDFEEYLYNDEEDEGIQGSFN
ncbi:hypothetical protein L596_027239 [Steinernema carpocapsae]|nr:hypothetical protein L596_027239 [Steinernema carpocapsae]